MKSLKLAVPFLAMRTTSILAALLLTGCMSWSPGWEIATPAGDPRADVDRLIAEGRALFDRADQEQHLENAVRLWNEALEGDPDNLEVLGDLSQAHLLLGAAYTERVSEKAEHYRQALRYAERAMATNPGFRRLVEDGASVSQAAHQLGLREMRPMIYWVTGVSYYFKECLRGLGHVVNFRWMKQTREVSARMMELDPTYEHGIVLFSQGMYYIGLPESVGGDKERAAELLARAIEAGDRSLLHRWGRAKYLHVKTGDAQAFREDLEWVLAQDPRTSESPYSWNVYFQRDAREMLAAMGRLFGEPSTRKRRQAPRAQLLSSKETVLAPEALAEPPLREGLRSEFR